MLVAGITIDWTLIVAVLTLVATVVGIILAYHMERVTQKITLRNTCEDVYMLLHSLTDALQRACDKSSNTMPQVAIEFAEAWGDELEKEAVIVNLCRKANIDIQSLRLLQLKETIARIFSSARCVFFKRESISGIDSIVELLQEYGNVEEQYCQHADIPFTYKNITKIKDSICEAKKSILSMDKEMTMCNVCKR